jgi:hypothetical protein
MWSENLKILTYPTIYEKKQLLANSGVILSKKPILSMLHSFLLKKSKTIQD